MALPKPGKNNPAVVTGASSGIGEALSRELASRGFSLIVIARREERLRALAEDLSAKYGVHVEVRPCDLLDRAARATLADELAGRELSLLCNNAGFVSFGAVVSSDSQRLRDEVELNCVALQDLTMAVLPGMTQRGSGGLLATGSIAGHQPMPNMATYSATKAFVNTFYESLHQEVKKTGVHCTVLAPGPVRTEITEAAGKTELEETGPGIMWLEADRVAKEAIDGVVTNKRMVTPGVVAKLSMLSGRFTPRSLLLPAVKSTTDSVL